MATMFGWICLLVGLPYREPKHPMTRAIVLSHRLQVTSHPGSVWSLCLRVLDRERPACHCVGLLYEYSLQPRTRSAS